MRGSGSEAVESDAGRRAPPVRPHARSDRRRCATASHPVRLDAERRGRLRSLGLVGRPCSRASGRAERRTQARAAGARRAGTAAARRRSGGGRSPRAASGSASPSSRPCRPRRARTSSRSAARTRAPARPRRRSGPSPSPTLRNLCGVPAGTSTRSPGFATIVDLPSRNSSSPASTSKRSSWAGWTCAAATAPFGSTNVSTTTRSPFESADVVRNTSVSPVTELLSDCPVVITCASSIGLNLTRRTIGQAA